MLDTLDRLCVASVSDGGVGNIQVPAACINDPLFSRLLQALVASYKVKSGNPLSNGDHIYSLRWRGGELIGIEASDKVLITKEGIKISEGRAREVNK